MNKFIRFTTIIHISLRYILLSLLGKKERAINEVFKDLSSLGGVYIKFLQLLVIREDLRDQRYASLRDSLSVFDNVKTEDLDIEKLIVNELGVDAGQLTSITKKPVASGSFAMVYKARYKDSKSVVIKALRPSITKNLKFDLGLIGVLVGTISFFKPNDFINYRDVYIDLKNMTLKETDYIKEKHTAISMYKKFINNPYITVPKTYDSLSTSKIIVQDFIAGIPLTDFLSYSYVDQQIILQELGTDLEMLMEEMAYQSLSANLNGDVSHGDPHPGNIYLLRGNKLALIDFGISGKKVTNRRQMLSLLREYINMYNGDFEASKFTTGMLSFFVPELIEALENVGDSMNTDVKQKVLDTLGKITEGSINSNSNTELSAKLLKDFKPLQLFSRVLNSGNRFSIKADVEATVILRSTNIYMNLLNRLGLSKQVVKRVFIRVLDDYQIEENVGLNYDAATLDNSYYLVSNWLDKLRYSDPVSYLKLTEAIK